MEFASCTAVESKLTAILCLFIRHSGQITADTSGGDLKAEDRPSRPERRSDYDLLNSWLQTSVEESKKTGLRTKIYQEKTCRKQDAHHESVLWLRERCRDDTVN